MKNESRVFLSYNFGDQNFVQTVYRYLRRQPGLEVFCYEWYQHSSGWQQRVGDGLLRSDTFVLFHGKDLGRTQLSEANEWLQQASSRTDCSRYIVDLPDACAWTPPWFNFKDGVDPLVTGPVGETQAAHCAAELARGILGKWIPHDGLPEGYIFHYEKDVIAQFASGRPVQKLLKAGCPETWPCVATRVREIQGLSELAAKDILNLPALASKLNKRADTVSAFIWSKLDETTLELLSSYGGEPSVSPDLSKALIKDLNRLIAGPLLTGQIAFSSASTPGTPPTNMAEVSQEGQTAELNRQFLEEAYSAELIKKHHHRNPLKPKDIGAFRTPDMAVLVDVRSTYHRRPAAACLESNGDCCLVEKGLTFPEAGPREQLRHGREDPLHVGILVSGGIAPGINAVIAGIVDRHRLYWKHHNREFEPPPTLNIHCYRDGFLGMLGGRVHRIEFVSLADDDPQSNKALGYVMENANSGGSMFGTSRYSPLASATDLEKRNSEIDRVLSRLWNDNIDLLYIIGGDGSLKAAHVLHVRNEQHLADRDRAQARRFSVVGIPKTMDNDILWVWQSFGFLSAVEKASDCLRQLHTEASSNPRLCVIQLFGSDSGFTVSHAALASLVCDAALISEMRFDMEGLFKHIRKRLEPQFVAARHAESPFGMIVMSETAIPDDWHRYVRWHDYLRASGLVPEDLQRKLNDIEQAGEIRSLVQQGDDRRFTVNLEFVEIDAIIEFMLRKRRVYGETPDPLRNVSLKLVSRVLQHKIRTIMGEQNPYWRSFRVFTNEPRHLLRATAPSSNDITTGRRFGMLAVDNAMAGYTDFMISQWLTEYVLVPLPLVVLGRKRVPSEGIFWKSVLAKTEQPENLCARRNTPPGVLPAAEPDRESTPGPLVLQ